jgi:hypothetical protein
MANVGDEIGAPGRKTTTPAGKPSPRHIGVIFEYLYIINDIRGIAKECNDNYPTICLGSKYSVLFLKDVFVVHHQEYYKKWENI